MHHRRIAAFLTGMWIAGSVLISYIAFQNLSMVDRVMATPPAEASKMIQTLGTQPAMMFLRYQASEMNRQYLSQWELAQFALVLLLAGVLYLGTHVNRMIIVLCGVVTLILGFMHFVITPELNYLGREMDFVADRGRRLWTLYVLYGGLETVKILLISSVAAYLFVYKTKARPRSSREPGVKDLEPADR